MHHSHSHTKPHTHTGEPMMMNGLGWVGKWRIIGCDKKTRYGYLRIFGNIGRNMSQIRAGFLKSGGIARGLDIRGHSFALCERAVLRRGGGRGGGEPGVFPQLTRRPRKARRPYTTLYHTEEGIHSWRPGEPGPNTRGGGGRVVDDNWDPCLVLPLPSSCLREGVRCEKKSTVTGPRQGALEPMMCNLWKPDLLEKWDSRFILPRIQFQPSHKFQRRHARPPSSSQRCPFGPPFRV